jgi:hypothetical protein
MANALEDRGGVNPKTAAAAARNLLQGAAEREEVLAGGMRGSEQAQGNREQLVAKDIMALLGFTTNEIKYLEKEALTNKKSAKRALADLHSMAETIHKLPITEQFAMRDELLLKAAGGGLKPGSAAGVANSKRAAVVINPKVLEHMGQKVRKARELGKTGRVSKKKMAEATGQKLSRHEALFVNNSTNAATKLAKKGGLIKNKNAGGQRSAKAAKEARLVASYRHLTFSNTPNGRTGANAQDSQFHAAAIGTMTRKGAAIGDTNITEHFRAAAQDNDWGENKSFARHGGRIGSKNMRRYIDSDGMTNDFANEINTPIYANQMVR